MDTIGILSLAPAVVALVLAFVTREALFSIMSGVFVGVVLKVIYLVKGGGIMDIITGFTGIIQEACGTPDFIWVICIEIFIGIMVAFFMKSGAIDCMTRTLGEKTKITARSAQMIASGIGIFVFFSDYFSPLFTGNVSRGITDKARVSREKLAYICDCTSAPVCICIPFTSWGVYVAGLLIGIGAITNNAISTDAIIKAVPFQFYGFVTIIFMLGISWGLIPDYGPMKKAELRAHNEGKVFADGSTPLLSNDLDEIKPREGAKTSLLLDFFMPAIIIIVWTVGTYIIIDSAKTLEAFVLATLYQAIVMLIRRMANLKELMDCVNRGFRSVGAAMLILGSAYCINTISKELGTANFVIQATSSWMTPVTLLAFTFLLCAFISFFTGTSWGVYAIMIPICIPLAFNVTGGELNTIVYATIAAVMGGGCFGDHCSPLSDTTILSSLGAGSDHIDHVRTQLPYALTCASIAFVGYIIVGFVLA